MSLGQLQPAFINSNTDKLCAMYDATLGTLGSGLGMGDGTTFGASYKQANLQTIVGAVSDVVIEASLAAITTGWPNCTGNEVFYGLLYNYFAALNRLSLNSKTISATIVSLDTLMLWLNWGNAASYWQCLASPDWTLAYGAMSNGLAPNPLNCYFVCVQGGSYGGVTFTNALGKLVVVASTPTTTLGYTIPVANYAGGFAYANVTAVTGSGVLTVHGLDQQGSAEVWTYTVTTTGAVLLVPTNHPYSLISQVTSVSVAAGITACTIYIEARAPAGRTYPPT